MLFSFRTRCRWTKVGVGSQKCSQQLSWVERKQIVDLTSTLKKSNLWIFKGRWISWKFTPTSDASMACMLIHLKCLRCAHAAPGSYLDEDWSGDLEGTYKDITSVRHAEWRVKSPRCPSLLRNSQNADSSKELTNLSKGRKATPLRHVYP